MMFSGQCQGCRSAGLAAYVNHAHHTATWLLHDNSPPWNAKRLKVPVAQRHSIQRSPLQLPHPVFSGSSKMRSVLFNQREPPAASFPLLLRACDKESNSIFLLYNLTYYSLYTFQIRCIHLTGSCSLLRNGLHLANNNRNGSEEVLAVVL